MDPLKFFNTSSKAKSKTQPSKSRDTSRSRSINIAIWSQTYDSHFAYEVEAVERHPVCLLITDVILGGPAQSGKINSIQFFIKSHDQGWSNENNFDGLYDGSPTSFEASIIRSAEDSSIWNISLEDDPSVLDPITVIGEAVDDQIAYFVLNKATRDHLWLVQRNVRGDEVMKSHTTTWIAVPEDSKVVKSEDEILGLDFDTKNGAGFGTNFISSLRPGDRIAVFARAKGYGSVNYVAQVEITITYEGIKELSVNQSVAISEAPVDTAVARGSISNHQQPIPIITATNGDSQPPLGSDIRAGPPAIDQHQSNVFLDTPKNPVRSTRKASDVSSLRELFHNDQTSVEPQEQPGKTQLPSGDTSNSTKPSNVTKDLDTYNNHIQQKDSGEHNKSSVTFEPFPPVPHGSEGRTLGPTMSSVPSESTLERTQSKTFNPWTKGRQKSIDLSGRALSASASMVGKISSVFTGAQKKKDRGRNSGDDIGSPPPGNPSSTNISSRP